MLRKLNEVSKIKEAPLGLAASEVTDIQPVESEEVEGDSSAPSSKMEKLEPGVYQDENGSYFRVTKDGDLKEINEDST